MAFSSSRATSGSRRSQAGRAHTDIPSSRRHEERDVHEATFSTNPKWVFRSLCSSGLREEGLMGRDTSRRAVLKHAALVGAYALAAPVRHAFAQVAAAMDARSVDTPVLSIAYAESGDPRGFPVILLHGFPDDAHAWDEVAPPLGGAGYRVLAPYL